MFPDLLESLLYYQIHLVIFVANFFLMIISLFILAILTSKTVSNFNSDIYYILVTKDICLKGLEKQHGFQISII